MGSPLPPLTFPEFRDQLAAILDREHGGCELQTDSYFILHLHYVELRRWNPRLSLVGPGTAQDVVRRHYAESLAALPLLRAADRKLVDLGSGAGFPGLVLAAALPGLEVTLVEARERKWAFLKSALRHTGLSCACLNARVERSLPEGFPTEIDVVTSRAVAIGSETIDALHKGSPGMRFLLWKGRTGVALPPRWAISRELPLKDSDRSRILEIQYAAAERSVPR